MDKPRITLPIIVEGRYDKIKLSSIVDADIITTDGFSLFNNKEKLAMLRRLADGNGVIVLTDPDGGQEGIFDIDTAFCVGDAPAEDEEFHTEFSEEVILDANVE